MESSRQSPRREDVERILRDFFRRCEPEIVAAYLFGSVARERVRPASDVDVGVLFAADPSPGLAGPALGLEGELEARLGLPVEVVALNRASADLVHRVLRDGRLVLDRDPARRIGFEVRKRNDFFDMQPVWSEYRRARRATRRD